MAQVTQKAVRVYGSAAYKGSNPQGELQTQLITLDPYLFDNAGNQGRALVYLGAPVFWVKEANEIRRAIGYNILNWFRGISLPTNSDRAINQALQELDFTQQWQDVWYVTIVLEQDIDVPDEAITSNEYVWLDSNPNAYERGDTFQQSASPHLDRLATLASTIVSPDAFEKIVIGDRVFFATSGHRTFGLPESNMSARLQVSRPVDRLDLSALDARLHRGMLLSQDAFEWIDLVTPWWLAGLREQDSWRAFVQFFTGLELLHKRLIRRYYNHVVASERVTTSGQATRQNTPILSVLFDTNGRNIKPRRDLRQRGEFAVLALALFPLQADADFNTFEIIKDVRDAVAHGEQTISEAEFPLNELRTLFERYFDVAIQEHLPPLSATP